MQTRYLLLEQVYEQLFPFSGLARRYFVFLKLFLELWVAEVLGHLRLSAVTLLVGYRRVPLVLTVLRLDIDILQIKLLPEKVKSKKKCNS